MKQLALDIGLAPEPTLDAFLGQANRAVLARLQAAVAADMADRVPVYLWGASGTGKTHLLRAARAALVEAGAVVGWLDGEARQGADFQSAWSAIFIDDVHLLDAHLQHVAFNWLIHALMPGGDAGCAVFAAGLWPPTDLPVRADLSSRLAWGDVYELHLPSDPERRAALKAAAQARGLLLPEQVIGYLLTHFARDLGSQMQLLQRLDRFALQEKRAITVPLVKAMLQAADLPATAPCQD